MKYKYIDIESTGAYLGNEEVIRGGGDSPMDGVLYMLGWTPLYAPMVKTYYGHLHRKGVYPRYYVDLEVRKPKLPWYKRLFRREK